MQFFPEGYGQKCNTAETKCVGEQSSIKGSIERKKRNLEEQLATVNEALEAMNANPELLRVLELVNKAR